MLFEYATVYLLDVPIFLDNGYDYYIPSELRDTLKVGSFVNVPFGNSNRATLAVVWRYLAAAGDVIEESPMCLCRKIVRWSGQSLSLGQMMTCLDIFRDVGLLQILRHHKHLILTLTPGAEKADLNASTTLQQLLRVKES